MTRQFKAFITTYRPISGWKAIMYWWNDSDNGFWEPWETSPYAFNTQEEANEYAKWWADIEDMLYVPEAKKYFKDLASYNQYMLLT